MSALTSFYYMYEMSDPCQSRSTGSEYQFRNPTVLYQVHLTALLATYKVQYFFGPKLPPPKLHATQPYPTTTVLLLSARIQARLISLKRLPHTVCHKSRWCCFGRERWVYFLDYPMKVFLLQSVCL
jgi:hypothetical protein